jgi:pimeloyl-ACP methyl ester carboxylesterase
MLSVAAIVAATVPQVVAWQAQVPARRSFVPPPIDEDALSQPVPPQFPRGTTMSSVAIGSVSGPVGPSIPLLDVTISVGGLGQERFLFQEVGTATPRPLLVVFHRSNTSYYDGLLNTDYFVQARQRGWYCVAPFGGSQLHYSSITSQLKTEAAFEWIDARYPIDRTRIYAVGFSMGGGAAMNYASRHLDPDGYMFAAVANISGLVSHEHTYAVDSVVWPKFDQLFGNSLPGSAEPWKMQRSSLFSFDLNTFQTLPNSDLSRNLLHLSTRSYRASGDIPYLITQNDLLHQHLLASGADPLRHTLTVVPTIAQYHAWDIASESDVCSWLRLRTLQFPSSGNTLADRDARFFHFEVEQDAAGAFTPFSWSVDTNTNSLVVTATSNLDRLLVHRVDAGLSDLLPLPVTTSDADGSPDDIVFLEWPASPLAVWKDGAPSMDWTHDAITGELVLVGTSPGPHAWTIFP